MKTAHWKRPWRCEFFDFMPFARGSLVQIFAGAPNHRGWKEGATVLGNKDILPGTAIATFVSGEYPSRPTGNHAALFLRSDVNGFWVMDQFKDKPGRAVRNIAPRFISSLHQKQHADGSWPRASDNADAYSIIEMR